jgi:NAD(P)-dependent dehydrogenase (short-subunit alcohol dehydrogenase family)
MRLRNKHALVTGSSRGIGRGIALKLAEEGATVAVHYYQNHEAAADTLDRIRALGSDGVIIQADVSRVDDVRRIFAEVRATFGALDIFVSNARSELGTFYEPPMEISLDKWELAFNSQARAFLIGVQEAAALMQRAAASSRSRSRPAARREAGNRGSRWARPRRRWRAPAGILPSRWRSAASP